MYYEIMYHACDADGVVRYTSCYLGAVEAVVRAHHYGRWCVMEEILCYGPEWV